MTIITQALNLVTIVKQNTREASPSVNITMILTVVVRCASFRSGGTSSIAVGNAAIKINIPYESISPLALAVDNFSALFENISQYECKILSLV